MKFTIERERLSSGLRTVSKAVANKALLPILSNVLLEADKDTIKISANDLGIAITTSMEGAAGRKGKTTIPAKLLKELVSKLPKGDLQIEVADGQAILKQGTNYYKLPTAPADDFPPMPTAAEPLFTIPAQVLSEASYLVGFAAGASADNTLGGVNIRTNGKQIAFAATDGYRLAYREFTMDQETRQPFDFTIPAKHLADVVATLPGSDAMIELFIDGDQITFLSELVRCSARRLAGTYPAYLKIVPPSFAITATVQRAEMKASVERVQLFGYGDGHTITLKLEGDSIRLHGQSPNSGEGAELIGAKIEGSPIEISVNAKYLLEALSIMPNEQVEISLNSPVSPIVMRVPDEGWYTSLLMPIRP